jgi:hypothetical protein
MPIIAPAAGPDALVAALRREHARHGHVRYEPVAAAANPEDSAAFVAVAWEYAPPGGGGHTRCGRSAGCQAAGRAAAPPKLLLPAPPAPPSAPPPPTSTPHPTSRGLSLKEFLFDGEGRVRVTRVARQMTEDEQQAQGQGGLGPGLGLPVWGWGLGVASVNRGPSGRFPLHYFAASARPRRSPCPSLAPVLPPPFPLPPGAPDRPLRLPPGRPLGLRHPPPPGHL